MHNFLNQLYAKGNTAKIRIIHSIDKMLASSVKREPHYIEGVLNAVPAGTMPPAVFSWRSRIVSCTFKPYVFVCPPVM